MYTVFLLQGQFAPFNFQCQLFIQSDRVEVDRPHEQGCHLVQFTQHHTMTEHTQYMSPSEK